ncbi:MAG TPA: S8 family serine peptidase, partial [Vicinamibacterales bacterium]|nr:S8 family serine peptidase [Vicinamibacterales bacterium]
MSVALALMTLSADALFSQESQPARRTVVIDGREAVEGEVIVRYRSQAGRIQRARAEIQADSDVVEPIGRLGARRLRSYDLSTSEMIARLSANPDVEFVEPNYIIRATAVPNDPSFGSLWGLFNTGQTVDGQAGTPGADIGATAAWDLNTGSRANIVAILDTGIDFFHPDLAANVFAAPRRFSVTLGSTTVTCETGTHGFNALNNSCLPFDDGGHGTHVAGIIGAVGNNNIGVTGVNWTTTLMAIKVLAADGTGTTTDAIKGIDFAIKAKAALGADANIRVINASWGGGDYSQALRNEIEAANGADMLFVAAAGSGGNNTDAVPHYPASLPGDNILSVAAVNNRGTLASFSNYGAASVDLAAPGGPTLSTLPSNKYGSLSGTSMAVPHVSGAAALVLAHCPSPTATLKSILMSSVDPEASLSGKTVSGGRLNVGRALQTCQPELHASISGTTVTATLTNGSGNPKDWLGFFCPASSADGSYIDWRYLNGTRTAPASGMSSATVTFTAPSANGTTCNVRLFSNNELIKVATSETVTVAPQRTLAIDDISVTEGNSGTSTATFTVTLSPANPSQTVAVNYATANGTASSGSDYVAKSGSVTFEPGSTTRTIDVSIIGDTTYEPSETFTVNLSSAVNASIADAQGLGTIVNDDTAPQPTITAPSTATSGSTLSVSIANGPGNATDWVGLFPSGGSDTSYITWMYLNGSRTPPSSGMTSATVSFPAPAAGTYNVRLFANNGSTKIATSNTI